jgi:DNA mismatch endonuclease (patch repair protein)
VDRTLDERGWLVLRFWEHEDPGQVASAISEQLAERRRSTPRPVRRRVPPS